MFSEPILTTRGIIVGRDYNGNPHYVQSFDIPNTYYSTSSSRQTTYESRQTTTYKSCSELFEEAEQFRQAYKEKMQRN